MHYTLTLSTTQRTFNSTVNRLHAANSSFLNLLFAFATVLVIWYGGRQIIDANLTAGELTQFILYLGLLAFPIRMAGWVVNIFSRAVSAGERIFQVIDARSPVEERGGAVGLAGIRGEVGFEDVSFSYAPPSSTVGGEPGEGELQPQAGLLPSEGNGIHAPVAALRHVNLKVHPGQKVALLGAPGSGKSTLVSLIPRFYDVTHGRLTVDGVDVRDMSLDSLRRNVGIVFQDVFLFMATVRENIAYGVPDAPMERIEEAARAADVHNFIMGLPLQYDTKVGERGVTLSGGQRQRLAIARTLLLDRRS